MLYSYSYIQTNAYSNNKQLLQLHSLHFFATESTLETINYLHGHAMHYVCCKIICLIVWHRAI